MPDADLPLKLVKLRWLWLAGLSLLLSGSAWLAGTWGMRP